jgi:NADPH:quinone reductase-like Zn-dependent oxidoreductase
VRALTFDTYTDAAGLTVRDLTLPEPGPHQVRIQVHAAGLNAFDWHTYRGEPLVMRLQSGLKVRDTRVVGADLSGVIDAVGDNVSGLSIGDRVMAQAGSGACAEFAVVAADAVVTIADSVTFDYAAATPMAALTALQALRDAGQLKPGESVLVWGASGGVGHLAIQVARALGAARVDGVCSRANVPMVLKQGADTAYDYTSGHGDVASLVGGRRYDVVLDLVATYSLRHLKAALTPQGRVITIGSAGGGRLLGPAAAVLGRAASAPFARVSSKAMLAKTNSDDLATVSRWLADGTLTPRIQARYSLAEAASACAELERGHVAGKLVIDVG